MDEENVKSFTLLRKHLQFRDDRMDSRGAGGPAYRPRSRPRAGQAGQTPKSLGLRIIRSLRKTLIANEMRLLLFLERLGSIFKRCRPKSFNAGPPAPLDLAFPWISITGKEMLTSIENRLFL